jgi:hypothetical protein
MEYIPGGSIRENIQKYGTFDTDVVKSFASQILDGLIYLHGRGLIHGVSIIFLPHYLLILCHLGSEIKQYIGGTHGHM